MQEKKRKKSCPPAKSACSAACGCPAFEPGAGDARRTGANPWMLTPRQFRGETERERESMAFFRDKRQR